MAASYTSLVITAISTFDIDFLNQILKIKLSDKKGNYVFTSSQGGRMNVWICYNYYLQRRITGKCFSLLNDKYSGIIIDPTIVTEKSLNASVRNQ